MRRGRMRTVNAHSGRAGSKTVNPQTSASTETKRGAHRKTGRGGNNEWRRCKSLSGTSDWQAGETIGEKKKGNQDQLAKWKSVDEGERNTK